jgi:uncharacterized membrane protein
MHILVIDEPRFKRVLRRVEKSVRESLEGWRRIPWDRLVYYVNHHLDNALFVYGYYKMDGVLFEYNKRWIEILKNGHGDYPTFFDFL